MPAVTVDDPLVLPRLEPPGPDAGDRPVKSVTTAPQGYEGEGFPVRRAFAGVDLADLDPFIHLDQMGEVEYAPGEPKGTPWHPHRGFETVTYMIDGTCAHGDSMGNSGVIGPGDVQWMTAGGGIIHQEMPEGDETGFMGGFQLWANLPSSLKMTDARYRSIQAAEIPVVSEGSATIRVVAGTVGGIKGPVGDVVIDPEYLDVTLEGDGVWTHATTPGHTVFAYAVTGDTIFGESGEESTLAALSTALFAEGDRISARSAGDRSRFLLVSGRPLREPVAWYGPIVMNTEEELRQAFEDYRRGDFVHHRAAGR